jgi:hypothetical protein
MCMYVCTCVIVFAGVRVCVCQYEYKRRVCVSVRVCACVCVWHTDVAPLSPDTCVRLSRRDACIVPCRAMCGGDVML